MLFKDKILRFLGAVKEYENGDLLLYHPSELKLDSIPGSKEDCFLFKRAIDIEDMEKEEDEEYIFSTLDKVIRAKFNRFQVRKLLSQFSTKFNTERIDTIIRMAWNYPCIIINKKTAEFEPFNDTTVLMPEIAQIGQPPRKTIYITE